MTLRPGSAYRSLLEFAYPLGIAIVSTARAPELAVPAGHRATRWSRNLNGSRLLMREGRGVPHRNRLNRVWPPGILSSSPPTSRAEIAVRFRHSADHNDPRTGAQPHSPQDLRRSTSMISAGACRWHLFDTFARVRIGLVSDGATKMLSGPWLRFGSGRGVSSTGWSLSAFNRERRRL